MGARSSKITAQNNRSDGHLLEYFRNTFVRGGGGTNFVPSTLSGITATGGVISDYIDPSPGAVYRAHVFTSSGTFSVSAATGTGLVEYLVVAGGAGGGGGPTNTFSDGAGGGAGGLRSTVTATGGGGTLETALPVSPGPYSITVGAGGGNRQCRCKWR